MKKKLTNLEFDLMRFSEMANYHGMKELDFIEAVYPAEKQIWKTTSFYIAYTDWYKRTQSKLARALK